MLLLNRSLTTAPRKTGGHRGKGWEAVTEQAIRALAARGKPLVSVLWGRDARNLRPLLGDLPPWSPCTLSHVRSQRVLRLQAVQQDERVAGGTGSAAG